MDSDYIVSSMHMYLRKAANVLVKWLGMLLPQASENWWDECVIENLSYNRRDTTRFKDFTKLEDFDLAALLTSHGILYGR